MHAHTHTQTAVRRCNCARCTLEAAQPESVGDLLSDMWGWVANGELAGRVKRQLAARETAALVPLRAQVRREGTSCP